VIRKSFQPLAALSLLAAAGCAGPALKATDLPPPEEMTIDDESEYRLGREVSRLLVRQFPPVRSEFNSYATTLARYLAQFSARPTTFKGYRVSLVNSNEQAAFSTPGGFIFISERLLDRLASEDELAAVIAHEIAHVVLRHGELAMVRKETAEETRKRTSSTLKGASLGLDVAAALDDREALAAVAQIVRVAGKAYDAGVGRIHETLLKSGYSQDQEYGADSAAVRMLLDAGYDPAVFPRFLETFCEPEGRCKDSALQSLVRGSLLSTHPLDGRRVERLRATISGWKPGPASQVRLERFLKFRAAPRSSQR
jgi:predicted Zn-dependent protease